MLRVMYLVPSHVRHLEFVALCIVQITRESSHLAVQYTQPGDITFVTVLEQHLQADADAKKGLMTRGIQHRIAQPARIQFAHAVRHRALAGEHYTPGPNDRVCIIRDDDFGIGHHMSQGLLDRAQIAHTIIDDSNIYHVNYSVPLVEGITPAIRGSSSSAMRSARPKALKIVSD